MNSDNTSQSSFFDILHGQAPFESCAEQRHTVSSTRPGHSDPTTMTSNTQTPSSKGAGSTIQLSPVSQPQSTNGQIDGHSKRGGSSNNFGAGVLSRQSSSPRNTQYMRKQHKGRRPKLGIDDPATEAAAVRSSSSRKGQTSITHLMNFSLPPRPHNHTMHYHNRHSGNRRPTWGLGSGYHAVDKARYIHANYRFLVDPRGDYRQHAVDPDVHLDWSNVLQILASAQSQGASCPICLSTPVAPRMAKCGHIFCLPCMIRFMHSSEEPQAIPEKKSRWKACPICWDSIYMTEMRPVRWYQGQEVDALAEGGDVVLRLVMRRPGSIIALPRDEARTSIISNDIPWHLAAEVMDYARILKGSEDYMSASYDNEVNELLRQEQEDRLLFGGEDQWTRKAISAIRDMQERCRAIGNPPITLATPGGQAGGLTYDTDSTKANTSQPWSPPVVGEQNTLSQSTNGKGSKLESSFFFYQALPYYYLTPLDIRILKAAFGEYAAFPSTILPRVEHISTGHTVDDDLRKRAKYLGHLPSGCEVTFLECDWTDIVPTTVLEGFTDEIERRRRRNREKEAREEKERLKAEKEEDDKRWAAARRRKPREVSPSDIEFGYQQQSSDSYVFGSSGASSSPPWKPSIRREGSAFASLATPSTSPNAPRTVWGTAAIAQPSPQLPAIRPDVSEDDGWLQDWERDLLHGEDELVAQVQATSLVDNPPQVNNTGGQSRKKKGKKITLMSTNARRAA